MLRRHRGQRLVVVANEDGYSRSDDIRVPGRRRRRALRLLPRRREGRVRLLDDDRAAAGLGARLRRRASRASSPTSAASRERRADPPPLRELRRRVDPGLPLHPAGRRPVPRRRHDSRRAGGAVAAVVLVRLRRVHAAPRLARLRGRGAERPRLERLRQALPSLDDVEKRLDSVGRSRLAPRVARRAARDRRRPPGRLRPLVRRLHGARRPRFPTRALGGGARMRRHLEPPHLPREHVGVPPRGARARVRLALRPRAARQPLAVEPARRDPRAALHRARPQRPARARERVGGDPRASSSNAACAASS